MKFTSIEVLMIKQLVVNELNECKQLSDECKKSKCLKNDLFYDELTKKYEDIEKKLNVLYEQVVLDEVKNSTRD